MFPCATQRAYIPPASMPLPLGARRACLVQNCFFSFFCDFNGASPERAGWPHTVNHGRHTARAYARRCLVETAAHHGRSGGYGVCSLPHTSRLCVANMLFTGFSKLEGGERTGPNMDLRLKYNHIYSVDTRSPVPSRFFTASFTHVCLSTPGEPVCVIVPVMPPSLLLKSTLAETLRTWPKSSYHPVCPPHLICAKGTPASGLQPHNNSGLKNRTKSSFLPQVGRWVPPAACTPSKTKKWMVDRCDQPDAYV